MGARGVVVAVGGVSKTRRVGVASKTSSGVSVARVLSSTNAASTRSVTSGANAVRVNTRVGLVGGVRIVRTSRVAWRSD